MLRGLGSHGRFLGREMTVKKARPVPYRALQVALGARQARVCRELVQTPPVYGRASVL